MVSRKPKSNRNGPSGASRPPREQARGPKPGGFKPKPKHAKPNFDAAKPAGGQDRAAVTAQPIREKRKGKRPLEKAPVILETLPDKDFALIDSGDGIKLERYGALTIIRPEQQAVWPKALPASAWDEADAVFTGDTDEEGVGRWAFPRESHGETWPVEVDGVPYLGRFTSFRHVGVFAEQASHWRAMGDAIRREKERTGRDIRVLNLFGYTGVASLYAANAGAHVTHVDASKKAIGWGRENQDHADMAHLPIRWICEDAQKFAAREIKRGNSYDIILLDPPAYGRGPNGEVWQLFEHLPDMLDMCRALLSKDALMMVLTAYAIRASFWSIHEIMMETMTGHAVSGLVESGELILRDEALGRALSTSMFSRWTPAKG